MLWRSSICVLCVLQLAGAVCDCANGQQTFIPSFFIIDSPSPFIGTNGSPSRFGSTCVEESSLYQCTNNSYNPLFDCSVNNNLYYGWNINASQLHNPISMIVHFARHFQSLNVSMEFLISTTIGISVPTVLQYSTILNKTFVSSSVLDYLPVNLPEGAYQHNFMLSPGEMFDGAVITIIPNTTFQWVAISKIYFCNAANEAIPAPSNDNNDSSVSIYTIVISVLAPIGTLMLIIIVLLVLILLLYAKKKKTRKAELASNADDHRSQQHTHTTAGVTSQGTDTIEIVNELHILTKAKSHDSVLQHNNSRSMPTADDYDDTIIPKLNLPQIIKRSKQEDYIEMDISGSIASDELYDDTVTGPAGDGSANIEPNPSYCLEHIGHAVKLEDNPSYNIVDLYD